MCRDNDVYNDIQADNRGPEGSPGKTAGPKGGTKSPQAGEGVECHITRGIRRVWVFLHFGEICH